MTTQSNLLPESRQNNGSRLPSLVAKVRHGIGRNAKYERIGVGWVNEDGSIYVKLVGTQIVSGFMLYELKDGDSAGETADTGAGA